MKTKVLGFAAISYLLFSGVVFAQTEDELPTATPTPVPTEEIVTTEGINGEADKNHRGPMVMHSKKVTEAGATILVDISIPNDEFKDYPVKVDFFVNNRLFSSQMRQKEIPSGLGIVVKSEDATIPFNYTIVATLLHPNRQFTTTVQGAVFATDLISTLDCTVSLSSSEGEESSYSAEQVSSGQNGNQTVTLNFEAQSLESDSTVTVDSTLTVTDGTASGMLIVTKDGETTTYDVTGSTSTANESLASVEVSSEDGTATLSCS